MRGYYFLFRGERLEQPAQSIPARWAGLRVHFLREGHFEVRRLPFEVFPDPLNLLFSSSEYDRLPLATKHYRRRPFSTALARPVIPEATHAQRDFA